MIITLTGENSFLLKRELDQLVADFLGSHSNMGLERLDGQEASFSVLQEAIQSLPFLASKKLVILKNPAAQKQSMDKADDLIGTIPDTTDVVIVEPKLDKRTGYYKLLKKSTDFREFSAQDGASLSTWLVATADGKLDAREARYLVERVGLDQQLLSTELEKLLVSEKPLTRQLIDELVDANPQASAFDLLDHALHGNPAGVKKLLDIAVQTEDPYRLFGLLVSQIYALSLVVAGKQKPPAEIAAAAGVHPFVIKKLTPLARNYSWPDIAGIIHIVAIADNQLKGSGADPWLIMEGALMKIATR